MGMGGAPLGRSYFESCPLMIRDSWRSMDWKRTSTLIYPGSEKRKSPATSDVDTFPGVLEKAT